MKKSMLLILAVYLLAAVFLPVKAEKLISEIPEAPAGNVRMTEEGNGMSADGNTLTDNDDSEGAENLGMFGDDDGEVVFPAQEIVVKLDSSNEIPDSDSLFAKYIRRYFYNEGRLLTKAANHAGRELKGPARIIYNAMKEAVVQIADGIRTSTIIEIPIWDVLNHTSFRSSELGVKVEFDEYHRPTNASFDAMRTAFYSLLGDDGFTPAYQALYNDCPYELYWAVWWPAYNVPSISIKYVRDFDDLVLSVSEGSFSIPLRVMQKYAGSDEYTIDTSLIAWAKQAAAKAKLIVNRYTNCSDYAKLSGYVLEICKLVTYNTEATSGNWDSNEPGPWQLLWVFDGDPTTNVVCKGYAVAFQYLCELTEFDTGVRCYYAEGEAGGSHAWNLVRMGNGKSYVVDVTWIDCWDDNPSCSIIDWIDNERGALFLSGGTGSVSEGYSIHYRTGGYTTFRTYYSSIINSYPASALTLAEDKYVLNGFERINGDTYYFKNGRHVNGIKTIDGVCYDFGTSGILNGSWTPGWHTIDGTDYYFDENGLHTEHVVTVFPAVPATCTKDGLTEGKRCTVCGAMLVQPEREPARGHLWGSIEYTVSDDGSVMTASRVCLRDAAHIESETAAASATVVLTATCARKGKTSYKATFTNETFGKHSLTREDIPQLPHTEVIDIAQIDPTCTETGMTKASHCSVCNAVLSEQTSIPPDGHTEIIDESIPPSCTTDGLTEGLHCQRCGTILIAQQPVGKLGHDWGEFSVPEWNETQYRVEKTHACQRAGCDCRETVEADFTQYGCGADLTAKLYEEGTLIVSGAGPMADYAYDEAAGTGTAPWGTGVKTALIGPNVTVIGDYAFYKCAGLTTVAVPSGLTSIGRYAFYACSALTDLSNLQGVTSIGESAFEECDALAGFIIPSGVTSLPQAVFAGCDSLTSVTISDNHLTEIGSSAFRHCPIAAIALPDSVTSIGSWAFADTDLIRITLSEAVASVGTQAFSGCAALESVTVLNESTVFSAEDDGVFANCADGLTIFCPAYSTAQTYAFERRIPYETIRAVRIDPDFVLPAALTVIDDEAFEGISATAVSLPETVASIGDKAFASCDKLRQISIPVATADISDTAFQNTSGLIIFGTGGSPAQAFAFAHNLAFVNVTR